MREYVGTLKMCKNCTFTKEYKRVLALYSHFGGVIIFNITKKTLHFFLNYIYLLKCMLTHCIFTMG